MMDHAAETEWHDQKKTSELDQKDHRCEFSSQHEFSVRDVEVRSERLPARVNASNATNSTVEGITGSTTTDASIDSI